MTRLQSSAKLQSGTSPPHPRNPVDHEIAAADARVREQEAHVLRLIVQGAPTQMAEDVLRQLMAAANVVKARKGIMQR
jgi:hypothetical protein